MPQIPYNAPVGVNYKNISAAGTVTVKSSAGYLDGLVVNGVGTAAASVALYDNTAASGALIGTVAIPATFVAPGGVTYGVNFANGLTIVNGGSTPANITVLYR